MDGNPHLPLAGQATDSCPEPGQGPTAASTRPVDDDTWQGALYAMTDTRYGQVRSFTREFWPAHDPSSGPGWYVFGRCSSGVIKIVAQPHVPPRRHPHYNIRVQRGWHRKRDAAAIAGLLARQCFGPLPETGKERDDFPPACAPGLAGGAGRGSAARARSRGSPLER